MSILIANAPCSWGIYQLADGKGIDFQTILDGIAVSGYAGTELGPFGFFPTEAEALKATLDERGLSLPAGSAKEPYHVAAELPDILARTRKTAELLRAVEAKFVVILCGGQSSRPGTAGRSDLALRLDAGQWAAFTTNVTTVAKMLCDEYGLTAVLHPHAGSYVEFQDEIDRALDALDSDLVKLCIDTGHCAYAGIDPVALYDTHHQRTPYFHFKNVSRTVLKDVTSRNVGLYDAVKLGVFCPLDQGIVDFSKLTQAMKQRQFSGWATVEQDHDLTAGKGDPVADAKQSHAYLTSIGMTEEPGKVSR